MYLALICGLFGLIIGSFLNVVILRHSTRSLAGRSGCLSCGKTLGARDLIPVLSWLILRGRCRRCGSAISMQYPLVEITSGVVFAILGFAGLAPISLALSLAIAALFLIIATYDLRHTIIPDAWAYGAAALALLLALYEAQYPVMFTLLSGPAAAFPLFALWAVSRGRWMGLGDSKLALGIGYVLGPVFGVYAVFYAFVIGAVISLLVLVPMPRYVHVLQKAGIVRAARVASYTMKSEVPFGPFLILSCFIVWFALLYSLPLPGAVL